MVREAVLRKALPDAEERRETAPKRKLIDRVIQRTRKRMRPVDPPTVHSPIDMAWLRSHAPELELIGDVNNESTRIMLFSTKSQLQTLAAAELWLCDGTFKVGINGN